MGSSSSKCLLAYFLLKFYLQVIVADQNMAFFFKNFGKDSNFGSQLALYGDAMVANDSTSIQIAGSGASRAGRIIFKKPINLIELNSGNMVSFSNYFVFSIEKGDGLAFIMLPFGYPSNVFDGGSIEILGVRKLHKFFAVEIDTFKDEKYGDLNGNHVGVDINSLVSPKVGNASSINLEISTGEKLQAWIDYEASIRGLEVRLNKLGENKPVVPLLSYPIDLSMMWKDERVTVGLSSLSGNSSQKCTLYSWSFRPRATPHWMHSDPMDPENFMDRGEKVQAPKRHNCSLRILAVLIFGTGCGALGVAVLIFGTGCGALGAFLLLFVWKIFEITRHVEPEKLAMQPKEIESKKFNVSVGKNNQGWEGVGV